MRARWLPALAVALLAACSAGGSTESLHPRVVLAVRDAATGTIRWTHELDHTTAGASTALYGGMLLVESGDGYVADDLHDGHELWTASQAQLPAVRLPESLVDRDATGIEGRAPDGTVRWRRTTQDQLVTSTSAVLLVSLTAGGLGGAASPPPPSSTTVSRLDPQTGRTLWSVRLAGLTGAAAVTLDAAVLVQSRDDGVSQTLVGLSAHDGRQLWSRRTELVTGAAAVGGAVVLQAAQGGNVAVRIDPVTGRQLWSARGYDQTFEQPFLAGERTGSRFVAYRIDPATGARVPGDVPVTLGAGTSGTLLVGADDKNLTALRGATPAWVSALPTGVRPTTTLATDGTFVVTVTATGFPAPHD